MKRARPLVAAAAALTLAGLSWWPGGQSGADRTSLPPAVPIAADGPGVTVPVPDLPLTDQFCGTCV